MGGCFTGATAAAVMTTRCITGRAGLAVVHGCEDRYPQVGTVTALTLIGTGGMGSTFASDPGAQSVMTTATGAGLSGHQGMIETNTQPTAGVMAYVTRQGGGNVTGTFTRRQHIVVAVGADICGLTVINGNQCG